MKDLNFNDERIKSILVEKANKIGINKTLKFVFESIMSIERKIYKSEKQEMFQMVIENVIL